MRRLLASLAVAMIVGPMLGCAEKKDKVRIQLPFLDVRVKEDGSTRVKAPGTDVRVDK